MLAMFLAFLLPLPQTAATYIYSGYTWAPAQAPVTLTACEGSNEVIRGLARSSTLNYGTEFSIKGQKTATSVRMRFLFTDTHWQPISHSDVVIDGIFTPHAVISRTHAHGGNFHEHAVLHGVAAVLCTPLSVQFSDGSGWNWTPPATPYGPPPSGRPSPTTGVTHPVAAYGSSMTSSQPHLLPTSTPSPQLPLPAAPPGPAASSSSLPTRRPTDTPATAQPAPAIDYN